MKRIRTLLILITIFISSSAQEQLIGINGTYAEMVRTYSYVMEIFKKGENYTDFVFDKSCHIFVCKDMQNEGVEKIVSVELVRTKAEGYEIINKYKNNMMRQGMKPFRFKEENGDFVYFYKNKYVGGNYCHSEVLASPARILDKKGYYYMVYSVSVPTL